MRKHLPATLLAAFVATGFALPSASAAPISVLPTGAVTSDVHTIQGYHRNCGWVNNGWRYRNADRYIDCRPRRPFGLGWTWRNEGVRFGWYNTRRNNWHYNNW